MQDSTETKNTQSHSRGSLSKFEPASSSPGQGCPFYDIGSLHNRARKTSSLHGIARNCQLDVSRRCRSEWQSTIHTAHKHSNLHRLGGSPLHSIQLICASSRGCFSSITLRRQDPVMWDGGGIRINTTVGINTNLYRGS